jgi:hypothetical protein
MVAFGRPSMMKSLEKKIMQRACSAVAAIIPVSLLSVAMIISADNAAQAKSRTVAVACGKELQQQCSRVPVAANNMFECLQKAKLSARCAALAHNIVRMCDRDSVQLCQGVLAGQGNVLGCLTTARGSVSPPCNAALNAAFIR